MDKASELVVHDPVEDSGNSSRHKSESSGVPPRAKLKKETGAGSIPVLLPPPPRQMRHNISDEQLQMLVDNNRSSLSDVMNLAFGFGVGLLVPSVEAIYTANFGIPIVPMNWLHIVELILMVASFAVGFTILFVSGNRAEKAEKIASELRSLHKQENAQS